MFSSELTSYLARGMVGDEKQPGHKSLRDSGKRLKDDEDDETTITDPVMKGDADDRTAVTDSDMTEDAIVIHQPSAPKKRWVIIEDVEEIVEEYGTQSHDDHAISQIKNWVNMGLYRYSSPRENKDLSLYPISLTPDDNKSLFESFQDLIISLISLNEQEVDAQLGEARQSATQFTGTLSHLTYNDPIFPSHRGFQISKESLMRFIIKDGREWLNDECINFVVHTCNHFALYLNGCEGEEAEKCTNGIAIPSSVKPHFCDYLPQSMQHIPDEHNDENLLKLAKWYSSESKGYLTTIFDVYDKKESLPTLMFMPWNITDYHWLYFTVKYSPEEVKGVVESVDYSEISSTNKEMALGRMYFTEFLNMHYAQSSYYEKPSDMYLHSSKKGHCNRFFEHSTNASLSKGSQGDGFNCGVICCQACVKTLFTKSAEPLTQEEMTQKKLEFLRYRWLIFIDILTKKLKDADMKYQTNRLMNKKLSENTTQVGMIVNPNQNEIIPIPAINKMLDGFPVGTLRKSSWRLAVLTDEKIARIKAMFPVEPFTIDHGILNPGPPKAKQTLTETILDIFMSRDEEEPHREKYAHDLCTYGCIFIADIGYNIPPVGTDPRKPDSSKRVPKAACIVERDIFMEGKDTKIILIHHLATKLGIDGYGYARTLLQFLGSQYHGKSRDVYISVPKENVFKYQSDASMTNIPQEQVKHMEKVIKKNNSVDFFTHMGMDIIDDTGICIINVDNSRHKLIGDNSVLFKTTTTLLKSLAKCAWASWKTTFIDPSVITQISLCTTDTILGTQKYVVNHQSNQSMVCHTHMDDLYMLTEDDYDESRRWFGFNVHFGWKEYDEHSISGIPSKIILEARKHIGQIIPIAAGCRNVSNKKLELWRPNNILEDFPRIPHRFRVNEHPEMNQCCVWLSACLLVNNVDMKQATVMLEDMKNNMVACESLLLFSGKQKQKRKSIVPLLQKYKYQLKRVKYVGNNHVDFLISDSSDRMYICILSDQQLARGHAVGIDCRSKPKLIWDCCENQALPLSQENLGICCGVENLFHKISIIAELQTYGNVPRKCWNN